MVNPIGYNTQLTEEAFSEKFCRARKARVLYDAQKNILGSVSHAQIFDLNGAEIAAMQSEENGTDDNGRKIRIAAYASEKQRFRLVGNTLYSVDESGNEQWMGQTERTERDLTRIVLLSILSALLLATIVLVALLGLPISETERPIFDISDNNGTWEAQGAVAVFGDSVRPGSSGQYGFVLRNPNQIEMAYSFFLEPQYAGKQVPRFPLQFRLRMNNVLMESENWKTIEELSFSGMNILPDTMQSFTLEWRWPFEAGNDANDTLIGSEGGKISMVLHLTAQAR